MTEHYYSGIRMKLVEAQEQLAALQSGKLWIGHPSENRTEAKIADLQRKIIEYERILKRAPTAAETANNS